MAVADRLPGILVEWAAYAGADPYIAMLIKRRERRAITDEHEEITLDTSGGRLLFPVENVLTALRGGFAIRDTVSWDNASEPSATPTFFDYRDDVNNFITLHYESANNRFRLQRCVAGVTVSVTVAATVTVGQTFTLVAAWSASTIYLSVDGAAFVSAASAITDNMVATLADIGSLAGASSSTSTHIWALGFNGTVTSVDAAAIHAYGNEPPDMESLTDLSVDSVPTMLLNLLDEEYSAVSIDPWVQIASIADEETLRFADNRVASGQVYEYSVNVVTSVFGDSLTSNDLLPPPFESVTFEGMAMAVITDETLYIMLEGGQMEVRPEQHGSFITARGRREPTAQYDEYRASTIAFTTVVRKHDNNREWRKIERFFARQQEGGQIFLIRPGHKPERYFAQLRDIRRADDPAFWTLQLEFQQVYYDESA